MLYYLISRLVASFRGPCLCILCGLTQLGGATEVRFQFGDPTTISFEAAPAISYRLQTTSALLTEAWRDVGSEKSVSVPSTVEWTIARPESTVFFRVAGIAGMSVSGLEVGTHGEVPALGLVSSTGFDFLAAESDSGDRSYLFRGSDGGAAGVVHKAETGMPLMTIGNYLIEVQSAAEGVVRLKITGADGTIHYEGFAEWTDPPSEGGDSRSLRTAEFATEFPDFEAEARAYVLELQEILLQSSWNLASLLTNAGLLDLLNAIEEARAAVADFRADWTGGLSTVFESDGMNHAEGEGDLADYLFHPALLAQFDLPRQLVDELRDRLDEGASVDREASDRIEDIRDETGSVVSEQRHFVRGRVTDHLVNFGDPVPGVAIYLFAGPDQTTTSNSAGEFGFLIGPGTYTIEASAPGVGFDYVLSQPFAVPDVIESPIAYSTHPIHLEVLRTRYVRSDLEVIAARAERRFAAAGERILIEYEVRNNGEGVNSCGGYFVFSNDYECMLAGSCGVSDYTEPAPFPEIPPGETAIHQVLFTVPDNFQAGDRVYSGGAVYNHCQDPVKFYRPEVLFVVCGESFDALPATPIGHAFTFTWEEASGHIDPDLSTTYVFFLDGTTAAYDSDEGFPQLPPSGYDYSVNGNDATFTLYFDNTSGSQTITGVSIFEMTLEGACGGSFSGTVDFTVNQSGTITRRSGTGTGFFMIE